MKKKLPKRSPNNQRRAQSVAQQSPTATNSHPLVRGWQIFVLVLGIGGSALAYLVLFPDISISIGPSRDPRQPFESHFLLSNNSAYSIQAIHYNCEMWQMLTPQGEIIPKVRTGSDTKDGIQSKGNFSIYCGGFFFGDYRPSYPPDDIARTIKSGILNIYIHFRLPFWPWEVVKDFGFQLRRDKEENVLWLPLGKAVPMVKQL